LTARPLSCLVTRCQLRSLDLADLQPFLKQFLDRAALLFDQAKVLELPGFTRHVLDLLQSEDIPTVTTVGAARRLLRPASPADTAWCLQKLRLWTKLAREVVQAEFPDFALCASFSVFNVTVEPSRVRAASIQWDHADFERLAKALKVDAAELRAQYLQHRPLVQDAAKTVGCSNRAASQTVASKTQRSANTRVAYPMTALSPVLERYCAWTLSTSGVEQSFSKADRSKVANTPASDATEERLLKLLVNKIAPEEVARVCGRAQELYLLACPGETRERADARLDKGASKSDKLQKSSEASWLRARRQAVGAALNLASATAAQQPTTEDALPEGLQKEVRFQQKKALKRKAECLRDGLLLQREIDVQL